MEEVSTRVELLLVIECTLCLSESLGGFVYADMSNSNVGIGSTGDLTFTGNLPTATCLHACYHIVGKHVSNFLISTNNLIWLI